MNGTEPLDQFFFVRCQKSFTNILFLPPGSGRNKQNRSSPQRRKSQTFHHRPIPQPNHQPIRLKPHQSRSQRCQTSSQHPRNRKRTGGSAPIHQEPVAIAPTPGRLVRQPATSQVPGPGRDPARRVRA